MKRLFIGCRASDIEVGAGATLAKYQKSDDCYYLLLSNHKSTGTTAQTTYNTVRLKRFEISKASIRTLTEQKVVDALKNMRDRYHLGPDSTIYYPAADRHHVRSFIEPAAERVFFGCNLMKYEFPHYGAKIAPNFCEELTADHLDIKVKLVNPFKHGLLSVFTKRRVLTTAQAQGADFGLMYGEAFESRWVRRLK